MAGAESHMAMRRPRCRRPSQQEPAGLSSATERDLRALHSFVAHYNDWQFPRQNQGVHERLDRALGGPRARLHHQVGVAADILDSLGVPEVGHPGRNAVRILADNDLAIPNRDLDEAVLRLHEAVGRLKHRVAEERTELPNGPRGGKEPSRDTTPRAWKTSGAVTTALACAVAVLDMVASIVRMLD